MSTLTLLAYVMSGELDSLSPEIDSAHELGPGGSGRAQLREAQHVLGRKAGGWLKGHAESAKPSANLWVGTSKGTPAHQYGRRHML